MEEHTKLKCMLYVNQLATVKDGKVVVIKWKEDGNGDKYPEYTQIPEGHYLRSTKFDGVRMIITSYSIESRSKMTLPNENLYIVFKHLQEYCREHDVILDGELYSHEVDFSEIISIAMTKGTKKEIPDSVFFHCFDCLPNDNLAMPFEERLELIPTNIPRLVKVEQTPIELNKDAEFLTHEFKRQLDLGFEGLMIRGAHKEYKFGRTTPTCGKGYKFKLYETHDAKIVGIQQATRVISNEVDMIFRLHKEGFVDSDSEELIHEIGKKEVRKLYEEKFGSIRTTNSLGRSVTSKKKEDRIPIEMASGFFCEFEGNEVTVVLGLTDERKKEIWKNKEKYISEFCEFKSMPTTKDLPRNPGFLRMRWKSQDE